MIDTAKAIYGKTGPSEAAGNSGRVDPRSVLPPDHQLGMRVPKGGSSCASCEYLATDTTCDNEGYIKWNGSPNFPAPKDEYCCDLYEIGDDDDK